MTVIKNLGRHSALLDRWRPETHNFHFPWGEMAVTLEDVALFFGLPCSWEHMGAIDTPSRHVARRYPYEVRQSGAPPPTC
jgi:hypothetical protein